MWCCSWLTPVVKLDLHCNTSKLELQFIGTFRNSLNFKSNFPYSSHLHWSHFSDNDNFHWFLILFLSRYISFAKFGRNFSLKSLAMPPTGQSHLSVSAHKPSWQPFPSNDAAPFFNSTAKKGGFKSNFTWELVPEIQTKIPICETREECYFIFNFTCCKSSISRLIQVTAFSTKICISITANDTVMENKLVWFNNVPSLTSPSFHCP